MVSWQVRGRDVLVRLENGVHEWLTVHSITVLRIAMGAVFFGFGVLKYVPGLSPAQDLAVTTTRMLTLHLIPDKPAWYAVATLECVIGLCLLVGKYLRLIVILLAVELVGILSPIVLLTSRLFSGSHHFPTLEGQYVLKDVILLGAGMVIAAVAGDARLTSRNENANSTVSGRYQPPAPDRAESGPAVAGLTPRPRYQRGRRTRPVSDVATAAHRATTQGTKGKKSAVRSPAGH